MTDEEMPKESSKESEVRYVSMQEANRFMEIKEQTSKMIAYGVFLCIISPLCLLLLGVFSESGAYGISENTAGMIGLIVLLVLVTIAVAIFIFSGSKTAKYEYLEEEVFETEYGVTGMVKERKKNFRPSIRNIISSVSVYAFWLWCRFSRERCFVKATK